MIFNKKGIVLFRRNKPSISLFQGQFERVFPIASNSCGITESRMTVEVNPCVVYFPNAFTPNNDGKNDRFGILNAYNVKDYHLRIYNRWGEVVFESSNPAMKWNGTRAGVKLDGVVFIRQCSFKENNQTRSMRGTVTLIR